MKSIQNYIKNVGNKWQTIFLLFVMVIGLAGVLTLVQPVKYQSQAQFLIVPNKELNLDIYTAAKTTEYLGTVFSEVIYSKSFFEQAMNVGYPLADIFDNDPIEQKKQWKKIVKTKVLSDTGIFSVNVFYKDKTQTDQLMKAIATVVVNNGADFHGAGEQVTIKTIDGPFTRQKPVQPHPLKNGLAGLAVGFLASFGFVYLFPNVDLRMWSRRKKKNDEVYVEVKDEAIGFEPIAEVAEPENHDVSMNLMDRFNDKY